MSGYTKDYEQAKSCCSKNNYYSHDNLFKYAKQNAVSENCGNCNQSPTITTENYCGKNCKSPNVTKYASKVKTAGDCWIGVL